MALLEERYSYTYIHTQYGINKELLMNLHELYRHDAPVTLKKSKISGQMLIPNFKQLWALKKNIYL